LALAKFRKNLSVRRIGVSYAIDIYYSASDAELAARIANAVRQLLHAFPAGDAHQRCARRQSLARGTARRAASCYERGLSQDAGGIRASQDYSIVKKTVSPASAGQQGIAQANRLHSKSWKSTATTYRRIYEGFLQSFMTAVQRQSFPITSARVITKASASFAQTRSASLILALAAMAGALCGIAMARCATGRSLRRSGTRRYANAAYRHRCPDPSSSQPDRIRPGT
jgi:hypothetical protein